MRSALAHAAQARQQLRQRQRSTSLSTVPPSETSNDYDPLLAAVAASILYRSPLPSKTGRPIYILNAAAFPDAFEIDYDTLLSYVLARLPGEDELLSGTEYEIIFFAGGPPDGATAEKKQGPGMGWYLQAYHVLSRATRKRLQRLYIVHPRTWVRVLVGVFGTIVSPKFRRKIIHVNTLSALALQIPIETLLIPPSVYLHDRKISPDIYVPFATGRRAFGVKQPLPKNINTGETRLPRVLRETTSFILMDPCIKSEGLFRIPPNSILAGALKEAYDRGQHFVIWKERDAIVVQPGIDQSLIDEVRVEDTYGAHSAASLIKQWYRDLREPIFPESSYEALTNQYGSPDAEIKLEDLVDLILPQAEASPLSKVSRNILTRHLLPLLAEVAAHEPENKMNAENLAICFSMCLVCGSNQLEDVKVSSIVKRILQVAVESWPELRTGLGISEDAFLADLKAPADSREYEDPLEEEVAPRPQRLPEDAVREDQEGHRIVLEDSEVSPTEEKAPALPPRPQSAASGTKTPALPSRPSSQVGLVSEASSAIPKRKPAPPIIDPPRYSKVFDSQGNSIDVANSLANQVPADGFGPPRRSPWSFDEGEKKGFLPSASQEPADAIPTADIPKRKAVGGEHKLDGTADSEPNSRSSSTSDSKQAAQRAAATSLAQQIAAVQAARENPSVTESRASISAPASAASETDAVFRKPSWPASARPKSLAKPVVPPRQSQTVPVPAISQPASSSNMPKPRAPSAGLLKRMSSMEGPSNTENGNGNGSLGRANSLQPQKLNLRKASVEDLRRLYEERVNTAQSLAQAQAMRRTSSST